MYATDAILATLMCSTRSNYSWDIVIEKIGDKLFFDKRDNTEFGELTDTCIQKWKPKGFYIRTPISYVVKIVVS